MRRRSRVILRAAGAAALAVAVAGGATRLRAPGIARAASSAASSPAASRPAAPASSRTASGPAAPSRPAAAWPQWGGPTRDFRSPSKGLASSWPGGRPRELWSRPLGDGYSGIVTDGRALYTMYRPAKADTEAVIALDPATGRTLWEHAYDASARPSMNMEYGPGPHATPLLVDDLVYAVGVTG